MIKKLTLFFIVVFLSTSHTKAQNWGGGIDDTNINWGFSFQYIISEYKVTKNSNWRKPFFDDAFGANVTDSLRGIASPLSQGFGVGFVVNGRVNNNIDVRFTPSLVFNDRLMNYNYIDSGTYNPNTLSIQKKFQATTADLPIAIKLKSDRLGNFRPYVLSGVKYSIDLASNKKTNDEAMAAEEKVIKNKRSFLSYEAGLGCDIYFEWFKMTPEVKLSYSFRDVFVHNNTPFASPVDKAKLRHFTFSLFFE